jgi:hypothetical protein
MSCSLLEKTPGAGLNPGRFFLSNHLNDDPIPPEANGLHHYRAYSRPARNNPQN